MQFNGKVKVQGKEYRIIDSTGTGMIGYKYRIQKKYVLSNGEIDWISDGPATQCTFKTLKDAKAKMNEMENKTEVKKMKIYIKIEYHDGYTKTIEKTCNDYENEFEANEHGEIVYMQIIAEQ